MSDRTSASGAPVGGDASFTEQSRLAEQSGLARITVSAELAGLTQE
jgi:hypothetical protein